MSEACPFLADAKKDACSDMVSDEVPLRQRHLAEMKPSHTQHPAARLLYCSDCGSHKLTWHADVKNYGGAQDGRICMREVGPIFYLGCDECSKTVRVIDGDKVAVMLTEMQAYNGNEQLGRTLPQRNHDGCPASHSEQPGSLVASADTHLDKLYTAFCVARDSFIKTHFPKSKLRVYLHNPLWYLHDAEDDRQKVDEALARYAVEWWKSQGMIITLNRQDGSFTINERE